MYSFKSAKIPPQLDIQTIMASSSGMEARFKSRFISYAGTSEKFNKSVDVAGQAIDDLRTSAGMINEQKRGIDKMFLMSERAIIGVTALEKESGVKQVDNIPLPTAEVRDSYGKKMGYIALSVSFLSEGLLHFMEQTIHLQEALESRDRVISQLAAQAPHMETIGMFEDLSVNDLTSVPSVDVSQYAKTSKHDSAVSSPTAPVVTNGKKVKK